MTTRPPRTGPRIATLGLAGFLGAAGPALAEDVAPAPSREASPAPAPAPKVEVTGFVDVYYGYGFNQSDPLLRTFDVQHDAFSLSLAEVAFTKAPTADSRVGFRVDLDFGRTADLVAAFEPESDGKEVYKHVQQGYVSLLAGNVQIDAGKFVTPIGAEVIESQDNWNYTRSILFGYAIRSRAASTTWPRDAARPAPRLSRRLGNEVLLKREDLQPVFSFKLRGAYNRIAHSERGRARARRHRGERGQPRAGRRLLGPHLGLRAVIVMPEDDARDQGRGGARDGRGGRARRRQLLRREGALRRAGGARPASPSSTRSTTRWSSPARARSATRSCASARASWTRSSCRWAAAG
jgi:hypothetical protein